MCYNLLVLKALIKESMMKKPLKESMDGVSMHGK